MFDQSLYAIPAADKRRAAVAAVVRGAIEDGTFTYTELLSTLEPCRSDGLEYLDGVKVNGNFPQVGGKPVMWEEVPWAMGKFRLVHVNEVGVEVKFLANGTRLEIPTGVIRHTVETPVRIPGTSAIRMDRVLKPFGSIADINDLPGERLARAILHKEGWPGKQLRNPNGSLSGTVVEWRWLVKEAGLQQPAYGVPELYARLLPRVEAWEAEQADKAEKARAALASKSSQPKKPAPEARTGV